MTYSSSLNPRTMASANLLCAAFTNRQARSATRPATISDARSKGVVKWLEAGIRGRSRKRSTVPMNTEFSSIMGQHAPPLPEAADA